jgi:cardiolipin synthase
VNIPNKLTILRILLIPFFVIAILNGNSIAGIVLFSIAIITDILDGAIAKAFEQETKLGSFLDPLADKLLLSTTFAALPSISDFPYWVSVLVISRDAILILGWITIYLFIDITYYEMIPIPPSIFGKLTTASQSVTIFIFLFSIDHIFWWFYWVMLGVTFVSTLGYLYRGVRILSEEG